MLSNVYFEVIIFLQTFVLIQPRTSPPKIYKILLIFPILLTLTPKPCRWPPGAGAFAGGRWPPGTGGAEPTTKLHGKLGERLLKLRSENHCLLFVVLAAEDLVVRLLSGAVLGPKRPEPSKAPQGARPPRAAGRAGRPAAAPAARGGRRKRPSVG